MRYLIVLAGDGKAGELAPLILAMEGVEQVTEYPKGLKPAPVADVPNPFPGG